MEKVIGKDTIFGINGDAALLRWMPERESVVVGAHRKKAGAHPYRGQNPWPPATYTCKPTYATRTIRGFTKDYPLQPLSLSLSPFSSYFLPLFEKEEEEEEILRCVTKI